MTIPVDELRAAATLLRETAKPLFDGKTYQDWPWSEFWTEHGAEHGLIREDEQWIALMSPAVADPLADWLEHVAETWELYKPIQRDHALAVARVINGGAP